MNELLDFWKYLLFDDDGEITGISDEAPEAAKNEYAAWVKARIDQKNKGIKV